MVKNNTTYLIIGIIALVIILKFIPGQELFALTGICTSQEPTTFTPYQTDITSWNYNNLNTTTTINAAEDETYTWNNSYIHALTVTNCTTVIGNKIITSLGNNISIDFETEGPKTITILAQVHNWCNEANNILIETNDQALRDRYFATYYTCIQCQDNATVTQTCNNNVTITSQLCINGSWTYPESCPTTPTTTPTTIAQTSPLNVCDFPGEVYNPTTNRCEGGCTVNTDCEANQTCDTTTASCIGANITPLEPSFFQKNKLLIIITTLLTGTIAIITYLTKK